MIDIPGRPASFALSVPGILNSESSLLVRKDIVRAYMKQTRSHVVWVVSGERRLQTIPTSFFLGRRGVEKLYELKDRRSQ